MPLTPMPFVTWPLAAHMFLDAVPGAYESVRQLLGHADLNTTVIGGIIFLCLNGVKRRAYGG